MISLSDHSHEPGNEKPAYDYYDIIQGPYPEYSPDIERCNANFSGFFPFIEQKVGDQETAQYKEKIYTGPPYPR